MTYNVFSGTLNPAQSINHFLPEIDWEERLQNGEFCFVWRGT